MSPFLRGSAAALSLVFLGGFVETVYKVPIAVSDRNIQAEAAKVPPVAWKLPLGAGRIDDMEIYAPGKLLVTLRKDQSVAGDQYTMLVDTATGRPLWRYEPVDRKGEYVRILTMRDLILFRFDHDGAATLVAVSSRDGAERWVLPPIAGPVLFRAVPGKGVILGARPGKDGAVIAAYQLASGNLRWERRFQMPQEAGTLPAMVATLSEIWVFHGAVEKLSAENGKTLWRRDDIAIADTNPPPRLDGDSVYLADASGRVHRLAAATGKQIWVSEKQQDVIVTNIFPLNDRVYLRGAENARKKYPFIALDRRTGRVLWHRLTKKPSVSNLLEHKGRVFFATATGVGSRDQATGKRYFEKTITNSGRTYPVHLKRFGDKIVFIGELIVAAVDAMSGKVIYSHGMNPVDFGASMTSLDARLEKLELDQIALTGKPSSGYTEMAVFNGLMATRYQNMSNNYARIARQKWSYARSGSGLSAEMAGFEAQGAQIKAQMNASFARVQAQIAFSNAMQSLGEQITRIIEEKSLARTIVRQKLLRRSILAAYGGMEAGEYVYRPVKNYRSADNTFTRIKVIHMPTGRIRGTSLSAPHGNFGLWNVIDFEKGVAYYIGVGLDPAAYRYSGQSSLFDGAEYLNTFLIARPVTIPK